MGTSTEAGPIDIVMIGFPGNHFNGEIAPALRDLVVGGQIRVVDLLFVYKDADGTVGSIELGGLGAELEPAFVDIDGQFGGGLLDAEFDHPMVLGAIHRRALAGGAARNQRAGAVVDLPVDEAAEGGLVQRSVAKRSHQGGNRAGKHCVALQNGFKGPPGHRAPGIVHRLIRSRLP